MKELEVELILPEGRFNSTVNVFDESDCTKFLNIYNKWVDINKSLKEINSRCSNLPEGLSEGAFCLAKGFFRKVKNIRGANSSFDCYDPNSEDRTRIQIKACSVLPDLTSFGPKTEWDRIFFLDFYVKGDWDGTFISYELETEDINNYKVNSSQTLLEQKNQGRRPRFSISKSLIEENKFISKEIYKITEKGIIKIE